MVGSRNFCSKLFQASRFALDKGAVVPDAAPDRADLDDADIWILDRLDAVTGPTTADLTDFQISKAIERLYHFVWDEFCDWYIEFAKVAIYGEPEAGAAHPRGARLRARPGAAAAAPVHPVRHRADLDHADRRRDAGHRRLAGHPRQGHRIPRWRSGSPHAQQLITEIRRFRADQGVKPSARVPARLTGARRVRPGRRRGPDPLRGQAGPAGRRLHRLGQPQRRPAGRRQWCTSTSTPPAPSTSAPRSPGCNKDLAVGGEGTGGHRRQAGQPGVRRRRHRRRWSTRYATATRGPPPTGTGIKRPARPALERRGQWPTSRTTTSSARAARTTSATCRRTTCGRTSTPPPPTTTPIPRRTPPAASPASDIALATADLDDDTDGSAELTSQSAGPTTLAEVEALLNQRWPETKIEPSPAPDHRAAGPAGQPAAGLPGDPDRRDQRQDVHRPDDRRAARPDRRAHRPFHLAAPAVGDGADLHRRRADQRDASYVQRLRRRRAVRRTGRRRRRQPGACRCRSSRSSPRWPTRRSRTRRSRSA